MIVRTACFEGTVKPEDIDRFDAFVVDEVVPLMKRFPGVRSVRVLRAVSIEDDGPLLHMTFESSYDSVEAMERAFVDPVRQALKARIAEIWPLFHGRLFHVTQKVLSDECVATDVR
jgi:hypothetical protein